MTTSRRSSGSRLTLEMFRASSGSLIEPLKVLQTVGGQDELVFDGETLVFDPSGTLLARGAQFAEDLVLVDLPLQAQMRKVAKKAPVISLSKGQPRKRLPLPDRTRKQMEPNEE